MPATEPVVLAFSIYQFFVVAILYTLNAAVLYTFLAIYRFNSGEQGLAYIDFGGGVTLGLATVICVAQHKIRKISTTATECIRVKPPAEATLQHTGIGDLALLLGIFWWGWSLQTHVHWIGPMIAMAVITWALYLTFCTMSF